MKKILLGLTLLLSISSFSSDIIQSENAIPHLSNSWFEMNCIHQGKSLTVQLINDSELGKNFLWYDGGNPPRHQSIVDHGDAFTISFQKKGFFSRSKSVTFQKENLVITEEFKGKDQNGNDVSCVMYNHSFSRLVSGQTTSIQWHGQGGITPILEPMCLELNRLMEMRNFLEISPRMQNIAEHVSTTYCSTPSK